MLFYEALRVSVAQEIRPRPLLQTVSETVVSLPIAAYETDEEFRVVTLLIQQLWYILHILNKLQIKIVRSEMVITSQLFPADL
jgi:hypothetical protein